MMPEHLAPAIKQVVRVRKSFARNPASQKLYGRAFASELHDTRRS